MTKQVNLCKADMLPGFGPVQLPVFLLTLITAILVGAALIYLSWHERQQLLAQETHWINELKNNEQELRVFQSKYPSLNNETLLREENKKLLNELQRARETDIGLADQFENSIDGFYTTLKQLSDYDLNGLWLNNITLKGGTQFFLLEGYSREPSLIPQYINQLGETSLGHLSIRTLTMERENKSVWHFTLSNHEISDQENKR